MVCRTIGQRVDEVLEGDQLAGLYGAVAPGAVPPALPDAGD
jgi:hypothetical protein